MTALVMITRDPFCHPWKRAYRVVNEAIHRKFSIVLALDQRSCAQCTADVNILAAAYGNRWTDHRFTPPYDSCGPVIEEVVHLAREPMVLAVADDEEPSPGLWSFAQRPTLPNLSWTVRLVTPTPDGRLYRRGTEIQIRLIAKNNWHWVGGISGHDDHGGQVGASQKLLWHYALSAPREFREAKMRAYEAGAKLDFTTPDTQGAEEWEQYAERHYWEDHPEMIVPMPADLAAEMPR